ncbi:hypothetical protein AUJ14_00640 [Candidatus Micrarchaeota archaeon CG1_02_55_22]|nr:MAG: hypothetical protein AUJ14_00640 [Candidatus Micrarchaeota archaeon CG1_02_55_22]
MSEYRFNPFDGRVVIVASHRAGRPVNFHGKSPFVPENEKLTPPTTLALPSPQEWKVRCFNNAFPALERKGKYLPRKKELGWQSAAFGDHEVIAETPSQTEQYEDFDEYQRLLVFEAYVNRTQSLYNRPGIKYVSLFKNHGPKAGASIGHEHSQILALPFVPLEAQRRGDAYGKGLYAKAVKAEARNTVKKTKGFTLIRPSFAVHPYELWLYPNKPASRLADFDAAAAGEFMACLCDAIRRVKRVTQDYNILFHQAQPGEKMFFHAQIIPRTNVWAGLELESGVIINSKTVKDAVAALR